MKVKVYLAILASLLLAMAAKREVYGEYWWYVFANFAIQALLIFAICLGCGKFVIGTVVRHAKP